MRKPGHAASICNIPGCPAIAVTGGRCAQHAKAPFAGASHHGLSRQDQGYDAEWTQISQAHLKEYPYCVKCGRPAVHCDHIIPIRDGGTNDAGNRQSMCHSCHNSKTAAEMARRRGKG